MLKYYTIIQAASAEQTINKSRFIAYIAPARSKEEADEFIRTIRRQHKDATHNVPALVLGDKMQVQWASDDGEPQGTSGAPLVQLLVQEGITNVVLVITRYFGGIKLGTGGLVRAYTSSAKLALKAAGLCAVQDMAVQDWRLDYSYLAKLQARQAQSAAGRTEEPQFFINDITYTDTVRMQLQCAPENTVWLKNLLADLSSGTARLLQESTAEVSVPR